MPEAQGCLRTTAGRRVTIVLVVTIVSGVLVLLLVVPLNLTGEVIVDMTREVILMVLFLFFIFFITLVLIAIERIVELHGPLATGGPGCDNGRI